MKLTSLLTIATSLFAQCALSASIPEPTDTEIKQAYQACAQVLGAKQDVLPKLLNGAQLADSVRYKILDVKKISCEKALRKSGYVCMSKVTELFPMQSSPMVSMYEDRLIRADDGWMVVISARNPYYY